MHLITTQTEVWEGICGSRDIPLLNLNLSPFTPRDKTSSTDWTVGWVGPVAALNILEKDTNLLPLPTFEPRNILHAALSLNWLCYCGSYQTHKGKVHHSTMNTFDVTGAATYCLCMLHHRISSNSFTWNKHIMQSFIQLPTPWRWISRFKTCRS
jgi:hypothetical protein